jgi:hypothetical protein
MVEVDRSTCRATRSRGLRSWGTRGRNDARGRYCGSRGSSRVGRFSEGGWHYPRASIGAPRKPDPEPYQVDKVTVRRDGSSVRPYRRLARRGDLAAVALKPLGDIFGRWPLPHYSKMLAGSAWHSDLPQGGRGGAYGGLKCWAPLPYARAGPITTPPARPGAESGSYLPSHILKPLSVFDPDMTRQRGRQDHLGRSSPRGLALNAKPPVAGSGWMYKGCTKDVRGSRVSPARARIRVQFLAPVSTFG